MEVLELVGSCLVLFACLCLAGLALFYIASLVVAALVFISGLYNNENGTRNPVVIAWELNRDERRWPRPKNSLSPKGYS
ncbi:MULTISPECIES: hypothetical protein [Ferrimonas]|uniref:hypothetical protein n=1 Tax=Ferrimonas TaxID=44011 RepID=UPI000480063A|nr:MULTISPECIES: hypothetical protein [Ferrimonas]USD36133.1 hypothetical protein J8Z22_13930 [Ferrimonas sp. SCSIO 43195]